MTSNRAVVWPRVQRRMGLLCDPNAEPIAGHILAVEQKTQELKLAIARRNEDQRTLIEKANLGEFPRKALQERTGMPRGTVTSRIRRDLAQLRLELRRAR